MVTHISPTRLDASNVDAALAEAEKLALEQADPYEFYRLHLIKMYVSESTLDAYCQLHPDRVSFDVERRGAECVRRSARFGEMCVVRAAQGCADTMVHVCCRYTEDVELIARMLSESESSLCSKRSEVEEPEPELGFWGRVRSALLG